MNSFNNIQLKLKDFIKKFYVNELIKGLILFFALGLLLLLGTLFVEYLLWLEPLSRSLLFWSFVLVEVFLLTKYIIIPLFKLAGLKKGLSEFEASKMIGAYFPEIEDKLLNMLQLEQESEANELITASIEQRSAAFEGITFKKAIDFTKNRKYVKYALIPILIWMLSYVTGSSAMFSDSLTRVVQYNTTFEAPAPFSFQVLNSSFEVVEGNTYILDIQVVGEVIPENSKIFFEAESYYMANKGVGRFTYEFTALKKPVSFYVESNGIRSDVYTIDIIRAPVITDFKLILKYPTYTGKKNEVVQNTGNVVVPVGTEIDWQIETAQTDRVVFTTDASEPIEFNQSNTNFFNYSKVIDEELNYQISTSNTNLESFEQLNFVVQVVLDEFPRISVHSDIDSITRGPVQFIGEISDDYGIQNLQMVYYDTNMTETLYRHPIEFSSGAFSEFYYVFPDGVELNDGINYELYFEVFDNDKINGTKKSKSRTFGYYLKTAGELKEELLNEQNESIEAIEKLLENSKKAADDLKEFKDDLRGKSEVDWNDAEKLEEFVKRQQQYQEMFEDQTESLDRNLNELEQTENLEDKKQELQKRIDEVKKLNEEEKLMQELEDITKKINKEELLKKMNEMAKKSQRNEQSLERLVELTKRFYVEQKMDQVREKLGELGKLEEELSKEENLGPDSVEKQEAINKELKEVGKDLKQLEKDNEELMRPMKLPNDMDGLEEIEQAVDDALKSIQEQKEKEARSNQKKAARKMKSMSNSMDQAMMQMEGESIDENIDDLRKIVENLIEFSFQQEALMKSFSGTTNEGQEFAKHLKKQQVLKEYFEHIDDSLYVLSLRLVKMGSGIQKEVSDAHYFIDESLVNLTENRFDQGLANQQFVVTAANNLANDLSNLLESLMNASPSFGKGEGNKNDMSLPDIIKKQGELTEEMKQGMKGEKEGATEGEESGEGDSEALYEIYKQQNELKELLKEMMGDQQGGKDGNGVNEVVKQMEDLEKELLEKGFTKDVIEEMVKMNHELLKLEKAFKEQGEDTKRTGEENTIEYSRRTINKLKLQKRYYNNIEILNRQSLPLRTIYKKKVQEYFKSE